MSVVSADELNAFFAEHYNPSGDLDMQITAAGDGTLTIEQKTAARDLRVGGYVLGPTQMMLADTAAYAVIFTQLGITPMAMTSNINMDFLRPAKSPNLRAEAEIIKLGRTLDVMSVDIYAGVMDKPCSRATVTFALPRV